VIEPGGADAFTGPYRGLEPFDEDAAAFFFGRDREARLIVASLFAAPLTLLYGASGVGKSSVLRAGVLPLMRQDEDLLPVLFPRLSRDPKGTSTLESGWQADPVSGIKGTMALALQASAGEDEERRQAYQKLVRQHEEDSLAGFARACAEASGRRLMVILDQFEEYSLYHPDDERFAAELPAAVEPRSGPFSFLVSLREDALARLDRFKRTIPHLWDSYRRIDHLSAAAAEEAIRRPLDEYNRRRPTTEPPVGIEDRLVEAVLRDVQADRVQFEQRGSGSVGEAPRGGHIETPYLQLVMTRLWERERGDGGASDTLRLSTFRDEGGAPQIVRTHLDRVMKQFTPEELDVAARVFQRLVTPSGAKIAFSVRDLAEYEAVDRDKLASILRRLEEGNRRILRRVAVRGDAAEEPRYEIFHDRLGDAILDWRSKRLAEQAREADQRHEAEQKRLTLEARAAMQTQVAAAMDHLGDEGTETWVNVMFYLVHTSGARQALTVGQLAQLSHRPFQDVEAVLRRLTNEGIVRLTYRNDGADDVSGPARYVIVHDAMAGALLEWHSQHLLRQQRSVVKETEAAASPERAAPSTPVPGPEFPYRLVRRLLLQGKVVPFLGAGAGLSARPQGDDKAAYGQPFLPSARELKELLARACDFPATELEASNIAEVASFLERKMGREFLDRILEETLGRPDYTPSETHRLLAEIAQHQPLLIITTNYDTLMEQALTELGVAHDVLAYGSGQRGWSERRGQALWIPSGASEPELVSEVSTVTFSRPLVCRLNGTAVMNGKRIGSYVVTEEEQIDWIMELRAGSWLPVFADRYLARSHLLSLGHSASDWSQRALLRLLSERWPDRRGWAVALRPSPLSVMTWQRYDLSSFNEDLNVWAARMRAAADPAEESPS
jgi:hypothetical protein